MRDASYCAVVPPGKITKADWLAHGPAFHKLFSDISFSKVQPPIVSTLTYANGQVWSYATWYWSGTGRTTGVEVKIPFHAWYRFDNGKIAEVFHFVDPTAFNKEAAAALAAQTTSK
ncbi:MAG: nuclear transport factor 2 family protein [Acidobacteria bacterium]|nr:nuclear transport factor 2 family protein [Acidobacteriota bacterium]